MQEDIRTLIYQTYKFDDLIDSPRPVPIAAFLLNNKTGEHELVWNGQLLNCIFENAKYNTKKVDSLASSFCLILYGTDLE